MPYRDIETKRARERERGRKARAAKRAGLRSAEARDEDGVPEIMAEWLRRPLHREEDKPCP